MIAESLLGDRPEPRHLPVIRRTAGHCRRRSARTRPTSLVRCGTEGAEHAWQRWWRSTSSGEACAGAPTPDRGSDAGREGRGWSVWPPGQPPGHDRRLDHPGVHERGGLPYGSFLAEHGCIRAGPAPGRGIPVSGVRATDRPRRASVRPGACAPQSRGGRRGQARLVRGSPRTAVGAVLHGRHRGLLGARRRPERPADGGAVPQPRRLRRRRPRRPAARCRPHREAARAQAP